jgi:hypothetical protein
MISTTDVRYEWRTSRGNASMAFSEESKARDWKVKQLEQWKDKIVPTTLYKITVETKVEQL